MERVLFPCGRDAAAAAAGPHDPIAAGSCWVFFPELEEPPSTMFGCFLFMCRYRRSRREKDIWHSSHENEVLSADREWTAACLLRFSCRVNRLWQTVHWKGCGCACGCAWSTSIAGDIAATGFAIDIVTDIKAAWDVMYILRAVGRIVCADVTTAVLWR